MNLVLPVHLRVIKMMDHVGAATDTDNGDDNNKEPTCTKLSYFFQWMWYLMAICRLTMNLQCFLAMVRIDHGFNVFLLV